jgi:hypothetical protein
VTSEVGYLSDNHQELSQAILSADEFNRNDCHAYARDVFDALTMAKKYIKAYENVLNGQFLNEEIPRIMDGNIPKFLPWS